MSGRLREKSLEDYGISKNRYYELRAFCMQYEEKKSKIRKIKEEMSMQNIGYQKDCEMIEKAAVFASDMIYPYILKSVTNDLSYTFLEYDEKLGRIPVGKTEFYAIRRLFYHYLDKMQTGTKWGCSNDTMMSSGKRKAAS